MKFLTQEQFTEMWALQDSLNTATSGPDWTKRGQNWNLAIKSEIMEFFDYIGWKWWKEPSKTQKPSDMQARLELVDIWHFLLSSIIEKSAIVGYTPEAIHKTCAGYAKVEPNSLEACAQAIKELDAYRISNYQKVTMLADALQFCEWSWEELYKAYIGKVALNNFRQANGYKEGTYQKIWMVQRNDILPEPEYDEFEDNYFLEQIISELSLTEGALTYEAVYAKLGIEYMLRC